MIDKDQVLITTVANIEELPDVSMNAGTKKERDAFFLNEHVYILGKFSDEQ